VGQDAAAGARLLERVVNLFDDLVHIGRVLAGSVRLGPGAFQVGPHSRQVPLLWRGRVRVENRFAPQVPALAALRDPQPPGPLGTRRALDRQRGSARQIHHGRFTGDQVDPADRDRPDTDAVIDRGRSDHIPNQRHPGPLGAGLVLGHAVASCRKSVRAWS